MLREGSLILFLILTLFQQSFATLTLSFQKISGLHGEFTAIIGDSSYYGTSVACLGDINLDGIVDVASGAHFSSDGGSQRGAVYVQFLDNSGLVLSFQKISSTSGKFTATFSNEDYFGRALSGIEDVNGDDLNDLIVSSNHTELSRGSFFVLFLLNDGTVRSFQKIWASTESFTATVENPFTSLGSVGDLNNDGVPDLAVAAMFDNTGDYQTGNVPLHHIVSTLESS